VLLIEMVGNSDPEVLKVFTRTVPEAMTKMIRNPEKAGLWMLVKDFSWNQDFRHGMAAVNTMLEVLGKSLSRGNQANGDSAAAR
jgi:uncharacterized protein YjgD (DUF1641 family)